MVEGFSGHDELKRIRDKVRQSNLRHKLRIEVNDRHIYTLLK